MTLLGEKWKRELLHERQKVTNRWFIFIILFIIFLILSLRNTIPLLTQSFIPLSIISTAGNTFLYLALRRVTAVRWWVKFATVLFDMAVASTVIVVGGGPYSVFYSLYFIILISNSFRYGMGMSLYVAVLQNIGYVASLAIWQSLPEPKVFVFTPTPAHYSLLLEGSKILVFWGVALYAGYLASHIKRQSNEILGLYLRINDLENQLPERKSKQP